jgi:hypothetical protein
LSQSWSTDFGDLDNDGDIDAFIVRHSHPPALYYNDGTNHYAEMTDSAGITSDVAALDQGIQVIMEDFDNDGLLDILVTNTVNGGHRLFWNLGDMEFDHLTGRFPSGMAPIHSAAVGDFNHDGFMDIIAGHGGGYNTPHPSIADDLLLNNGNDNNFISIRTIGDASNRSGVGTRIVVQSALGVQLRDIRAGESYGITNSLNAHFGLAQDELIDSMILYWPSGTTDLFENIRANQFLTLREGIGPCDCENPGEEMVTTSTGTGAGSLYAAIESACPCDTITIDEALGIDTIVIDQKLMIAKDLVIRGFGPHKYFISTTTNGPAIRIQPGVKLAFVDLAIADEAVTPPTFLIENMGTLIFSNVVVQTADGLPLRQNSGTIVIGPGDTVIK